MHAIARVVADLTDIWHKAIYEQIQSEYFVGLEMP